jgi:hypothetical protein
MTEFEKVLQECLLALESGDANLGECLNRYPGYALALEPILLTSLDLERGREARPSAAFKARVRAKLTQEMQAHPRRSIRFHFMFMRMATNLAVILLALLAAGTAYAQSAMPGNPFYPWKLISENAWRMVSPDPVGTDLAIADRRADELIALGNNAEQHAQTVDAYLEVLARLELEVNVENEARIRQVLNSQIEELNKSGIFLPQSEQNIPPILEEPTVIPTVTPLLIPEIPQVNPTLPLSVATSVPVEGTVQGPSTDSPKIVPTLPVGVDNLPTVQVPSLLP